VSPSGGVATSRRRPPAAPLPPAGTPLTGKKAVAAKAAATAAANRAMREGKVRQEWNHLSDFFLLLENGSPLSFVLL
jgi:hypothetical protein